MPYFLEQRGNRFKLRLKDNPEREFSRKYLTKKKALAQMQAIEISKKQRAEDSGSGLITGMLGKIKRSYNSIVNTLIAPPVQIASSVIPELSQYSDGVKNVLNKYGNFGIVKMTIEKQPVNSKIMFLVNKITDNQLRELMVKHNIDAYYHISLCVDVIDDIGRILSFRIEKNENISIIPYEPISNSQYLNVQLDMVPRTMNTILTQTRLDIGEAHFYLYRFDSWNCADFIMEILRSNNLLTQQSQDFIYQNTEILRKEIKKSTRDRLHLITKLASRISHLRGRGLTPKFRFL